MKNKILVSLAVLVMAVFVIVPLAVKAQSDYASRASYSPAKAPQSTRANIHKREGTIVGHYVFSIDGLAATPTNGLLTIKEGIGNVYMPDNGIVLSNGVIDITTAANPTTCTGAIFFGSSMIYTGSLGTATTTGLLLADYTKFTTNSNLRIQFNSNVPTNALTVSIYQPYILGN